MYCGIRTLLCTIHLQTWQWLFSMSLGINIHLNYSHRFRVLRLISTTSPTMQFSPAFCPPTLYPPPFCLHTAGFRWLSLVRNTYMGKPCHSLAGLHRHFILQTTFFSLYFNYIKLLLAYWVLQQTCIKLSDLFHCTLSTSDKSLYNCYIIGNSFITFRKQERLSHIQVSGN